MAGYALQTAFIGAGAVIGSATPWLLDHMGVSNVAAAQGIPDTVRISFYIGGAALFLAVLWTVLTTREYAPDQMARFAQADGQPPAALPADRAMPAGGPGWIVAGGVILAIVWAWSLEKELYLLGALLAAYGCARLVARRLHAQGRSDNLLSHVVGDFATMPPLMKRLALVQFFTWSALFIMWIYTTPVVAQYMFGSADPIPTPSR